MAEGPRVWAATRVGLVRTANEDGWRVGGIASDAPDGNWSGSLPSTRPWVLVADGMGGHGSGDVASSIALDALCRHFDRDGASDIRSAIAAANWAVFSAMDEPPGRRAMGTTVAGFRRAGGAVSVFNVGDSRIYLARDGGLSLLSVDDTIPSRAAARSHALTQSLGGTSVPLPLDPHVVSVEPVAGDVLLVCTDGLTDMLGEAEIVAGLLAGTANPAAALANAAVEAGGRDNVTVIVTEF